MLVALIHAPTPEGEATKSRFFPHGQHAMAAAERPSALSPIGITLFEIALSLSHGIGDMREAHDGSMHGSGERKSAAASISTASTPCARAASIAASVSR
jgi:hypothetical protein